MVKLGIKMRVFAANSVYYDLHEFQRIYARKNLFLAVIIKSTTA
jgi:hypothetical protein